MKIEKEIIVTMVLTEQERLTFMDALRVYIQSASKKREDANTEEYRDRLTEEITVTAKVLEKLK